MNIVFFNTKDYELDFLKENLPKEINPTFLKYALNKQAKIPKEYETADAISIFALNYLGEEELSKFKNLKYIFTRSVGFSHINKEYCTKHNIKVFNTPHYGDYTVAEFTFGILLTAIRKIKQATNSLKEGNVNLQDFIGVELYSKTIGIIGLGAIGQKVEKIAQGFSMNTICYDVYPTEGYNYTTLDELCEKSDIITLHAPLTENNYHLLNKKMFEKMKKGVIIINTARGELIDTRALLGAIEEEKIAFCALDVVECENVLTNHNSDDFCLESIQESCLKKFMLNQKLLSYKNVLITPHIAYDTNEATRRILEITIENIENILAENYKNMVF